MRYHNITKDDMKNGDVAMFQIAKHLDPKALER